MARVRPESVITPVSPSPSDSRFIRPCSGEPGLSASAAHRALGSWRGLSDLGSVIDSDGSSSSIRRDDSGLALLTRMNCSRCVSISSDTNATIGT